MARDFPGGPEVKILHFRCRGEGSPPGQGTKILHAAKPERKKKKKAAPRQRGQAEFKKKRKGKKKRDGCNTVVANMTLHGSVCLLSDLLRQVKKMPSRSKGTWGPEKRSSPRGPLRSRQRNPGGGTEDTAWEKACQRQELPGDKDEEQCRGYKGQEGTKANTVS